MPSPIIAGRSDASGASEWGDITGTLSAQTDLQTALDAKVGLLASVPGVNLNTTDPTTLYTCPVGKSCIVLWAVMRNASVDIAVIATEFFFAVNAVDWSKIRLDHTKMTTANVYVPIFPGTNALVPDVAFVPSVLSAGQIFDCRIQTEFGSAATITVDVYGYLF